MIANPLVWSSVVGAGILLAHPPCKWRGEIIPPSSRSPRILVPSLMHELDFDHLSANAYLLLRLSVSLVSSLSGFIATARRCCICATLSRSCMDGVYHSSLSIPRFAVFPLVSLRLVLVFRVDKLVVYCTIL